MNTPQAAPLRRTLRLLASLLPAALTLLLLSASPPTLAAPPVTGVIAETGQLLTSLSPPTPASGSYDFQFQLFNAASGGAQVGATQSLAALPVVDGVFYAEINFGAVVGTPGLYLQTSYRVAGTTAYTVQSPRKLLPQSGYADYATEAGYAATAGTATSAGTASVSNSTKALLTKALSAALPTTGQVLTYNGTLWAPATPTTGGAYTAGAGLALAGNQFSIPSGGVTGAMLALPLALNASNSSPLLSVTNSGSTGIIGQSSSGFGVIGQSGGGYGVYGFSTAQSGSGGLFSDNNGTGVQVTGGTIGVKATSANGTGVIASGGISGVYGSSSGGEGGHFLTTGGTNGVYGESDAADGNGGYFSADSGTDAYGVYGRSATGYGAVGSGALAGVQGVSSGGNGVFARSGSSAGVLAESTSGTGVLAESTSGAGVFAQSTSGAGVLATSGGTTPSTPAIYADNTSSSGIGIYSTTNSSGANLVVSNTGAGDLIQGFHGPNNLYFRVTASGVTVTRVLQITGGADVAEPYVVAPAGGETPRPGLVVSIDPDRTGRMTLAHTPYDRTVAGILSGAGGIQPGLTLRQKDAPADGALPVACTGRVWCWCDAGANGGIRPGDLLTTSDTPGHAMRATDDRRSRGAVLGKAMSSLASGKGLVLVLVTLE